MTSTDVRDVGPGRRVHGRLATRMIVATLIVIAASLVGTGAADAETTKPATLPFIDECPALRSAPAETLDGQQRRTIIAAYCGTLRRLPDAAGFDYWTAELESGLSPIALVGQLMASDEYRARSTLSFRDALSLVGSDRVGGGDGPPPDDEVQPESAVGADGLSVRAAMTSEAFGRFVEERALEGLDWITPAMAHGRLSGHRQAVNVVYVHLSRSRGMRVSPATDPRRPVGAWADEIGAHAAINGNWFAPFDGPAVSAGEVYGGNDHGYTALFGMTAERDAIVEHHREVNGEVDDRIVEGVSGHPTLIHDGVTTSDFGGDPTFASRHPRTAIGLDSSGDVLLLVTVDGRSSVASGMTGPETAALLAQLGADDAVMLDGGGSTTMWIQGRGVVNTPSEAVRAVGNQVAVFGD